MYLVNVRVDSDDITDPQIHDLKTLLSSSACVIIGRDPDKCDISLDCKNLPAMVSRKHAELRYDGDTLLIQDTNSVNGTWLNGRKIPAREWKLLEDGDMLSFGGTIEVHRDSCMKRNPFVYMVSFNGGKTSDVPNTHKQQSDFSSERLDENSSSRLNSIVMEQGISAGDAGDVIGSGPARTSEVQAEPVQTQGGRGTKPESEFECPICTELMCYPVTLVPCGHSYCSECICKAFQLQSKDRRVCPMCRSKPSHAPMRVQLLAHSLARAVSVLPAKEKQQYQERCSVQGAFQEERDATLRKMFGKKSASAVTERVAGLGDARRASEMGLVRRREEYRGGGGAAADRNQAGGMNQRGEGIRLGMLRDATVALEPWTDHLHGSGW